MKEKDLIFNPLPKGKCYSDHTGEKVGMITFLGYAGKIKNRKHWWCKCECGTIKEMPSAAVICKAIKSCGCLNRLSKNKGTHNMSTIPEYKAYQSAKRRCTKEKCKAYKNYGAKGVKFLFKSFDEFIIHIGMKPEDHKTQGKYTLDRINVYGNYEKGNVRWATMKTQANNKRERPPLPEYKPMSMQVPKALYNALKAKAEQEGISLNKYCLRRLE